MQNPDEGAQLRNDALQILEHWASLNRPLLEAVFRLFVRHRRWPRLTELDARSGLGPGYQSVSRNWSRIPLGLVRTPADGSAALLARALSFVPEADSLLLCLTDLVQLAVRCYLEEGTRAILDAAMVLHTLGADPDLLQLAIRVLRHEPTLGGDWLADGYWAWILRDGILEYRNARTPRQFLDAQAWLLWPDGPVSPIMLRAVHERSAEVQLMPSAGLTGPS